MDQPNLFDPGAGQHQQAPGNHAFTNQQFRSTYLNYSAINKWLACLSLVLLGILLVADATKSQINYNYLFTREQWQEIIAALEDPTVIPVLSQGNYGDIPRTDAAQNDFVFGNCLVRMWVHPQNTQYLEASPLKTILGLGVCLVMFIWILVQAVIGV